MTETPKLTYNPLESDKALKMSKSSFMLYNLCPRKYWWQYIAIPDLRPPPTPEMIRGSAIHKAMEPVIEAPKDKKKIKKADETIIKEGYEGDFGYSIMKDLLADMEEKIGKWELLQAEMKMTVYDERLDIWLVGAIDGLLKTEDGKIILVELKTGNMNESKLSRTRRELAYYTYMLNLTGDWPMPTHFLFIAPDASNEKTLEKLMKQKRKVVGCGLTQGMFVLEPISLRTINAFMEVYENTVVNIKTKQWPMKWNEYFCTQYCDYIVQCEPETLGIADDPTIEEEEE